MKENNWPLRMLSQAEIPFENERQKKMFSGTQKLKEFIAITLT